MLLKEYVRKVIGDTDEDDRIFTDAELDTILKGAVVYPRSDFSDPLAIHRGAEVQTSGSRKLTLSPRDARCAAYFSEIGGWLDSFTSVEVNGEAYALREGDAMDNVAGEVTFATPRAPMDKVVVRTFVVNVRRAIYEAMTAMAASESKLAVRASLDGFQFDLALLADSIRDQAKEYLGERDVPIADDFGYAH
jgi:hypothetical protein